MGWKTGAAAGAAAGAFGGPVGAAIGASIGAMVGKLCESSHDEGVAPVAIWRENELFFVEKAVSLPFSCIGKVKENDETSYIEITHKGGLWIRIPNDRIVFEDGTDEVAVISRINDSDSPHSIDEHFGNGDDKETPEIVVANIENALSMLEDAKNTYELIVGSDDIVLSEELAILGVGHFMSFLAACIEEDDLDVSCAVIIWRRDNLDRLKGLINIASYWQDKIVNNYDKNEVPPSFCAESCSRLRYDFCYRVLPFDMEDVDEVGYAWIQSAYSDGDLPNEAVWLKWLDEKWASPNNAKHRKVIVCTEEPRALDKVGVVDAENAIMRARDLEKVLERQRVPDELETLQGQRKAARESEKDIPITKAALLAKEYRLARESRRLVFEVGHPRNNAVYIQHPFAPNTYMELSAFHSSMLERKYNELIRILVALGAKHIECSVENTDRSSETTRSKRNANAEFSVGGTAGVSGEWSNSRSSSKDASLYKKLNTEMDLVPQGTPHLPDNLLYYPFEDGWKRVADDVMAGRLVRAKIDLTYSSDYAVTGQFTSSLKTKIHSEIPGFMFGVNGGFDREVEEELTKLESTVWHYTVEFGSADELQKREHAKDDANTSSEPTVDILPSAHVSTETNKNMGGKAEQLFLKRAKRYAQSEGHVDAEQRSDLEKFAHKYGIDEFRMEELIEEAFE